MSVFGISPKVQNGNSKKESCLRTPLNYGHSCTESMDQEVSLRVSPPPSGPAGPKIRGGHPGVDRGSIILKIIECFYTNFGEPQARKQIIEVLIPFYIDFLFDSSKRLNLYIISKIPKIMNMMSYQIHGMYPSRVSEIKRGGHPE